MFFLEKFYSFNALLSCIFGVNTFVVLSTKKTTEKISAGAICYAFMYFMWILIRQKNAICITDTKPTIIHSKEASETDITSLKIPINKPPNKDTRNILMVIGKDKAVILDI